MLRRLSTPLAALFAGVVGLRRWAYDVGLLPQHGARLPVISVGGLEAGGSGKTPVTGYLLAALVGQGLRVGLLTRGYGRRSRGLVVRLPGQPADPASLGDEPAMLVAAGHDVVVACCADRCRGAAALAALGCQVAVMDDGFVHRRLARDVDVVVLRAEAPLGDGYFLPRGGLREAPAALRRADVIWLHEAATSDEASDGAQLGRAGQGDPPGVGDAPPAAPQPPARRWPQLARLAETRRVKARPVQWICSQPVAAGLGPHGGDGATLRRVLAAGPVVAAAGIARPQALAAALRQLGAELPAFRAFADHHAFTAADAVALAALGRAHGAQAVVVTAKDYVKLAPLWPPAAVPLWALRQAVAVNYPPGGWAPPGWPLAPR